jgi:hypothetical protein
MEDPKLKEEKKDKKKKDKKENEEEGEPSLNFLKVDRSLRPTGFHFDNEMQGWSQKSS